MSNTGTPAGWYPDPENPGQTRYWDGAVWAAPTGAGTQPPPVAPGGGSGGRKTALIAVAIIAVLALVGGGIYWVTSGDDGDDDENQIATDGGDDEDDGDDGDDGDGGDVEELSEEEFTAQADEICTDLDDNLDDISDEHLGHLDSPEDVEDVDSDDLEEFEGNMLAAVEDGFGELQAIAPEGEADEWSDLLDDWQGTYEDLISQMASGSFEFSDDLLERQADVEERVSDFGLECLGGSSSPASSDGGDTVDVPDSDSDGGDDSSSEGGDGASASSSTDVGEATEPPAFDDPALEPLGEDCYNGDMQACDDLYFESAVDSPGEEYGDTCGGRTEGGPFCTSLTDDN